MKERQLVSGTAIMLLLGLLYAWSIFRSPLTGLFPGWTATQISVTFTLSLVFFCIGGFAAGTLAGKVSHRLILRISAAMLLIGFVMITLVLNPDAEKRSLYFLYIFYGFFGGGGVGLSYNAVLGAVTRWFPGRSGLASGFLLLGFGIGGIALGTIVSFLDGLIGIINVFAVVGVIMSIVLFALSFILRAPSKDELISIEKPAEQEPKHSLKDERDYTPSKVVRTATFWIFFSWTAISAAAGLLIINSAANIAVFFGAPAVLGLIVSVFNGVGRPVVGMIYDRLGRLGTMLICVVLLIMSGVVLTLGAISGSAIPVLIGLLLVGIGYGGIPVMVSVCSLSFFGPKSFAVNLAIATFALIPASVIGPLVSSRLQENSGGDYFTTFIMLIIIGVISLGLTIVVNASSKKL